MSDRPSAPQGGSSMREIAPGLHPITLRAALATRSAWVDAVVESPVSGDAGERAVLVARDLDGQVWLVEASTETLSGLEAGAAIAVHRLYGVLAAEGVYSPATLSRF